MTRLFQVSSKGAMYTTATLYIISLLPNIALPETLAVLASGVGSGIITSMVERIAGGEKLSDEEIQDGIRTAIKESRIVTKDEFWHAFAHLRKGQHKLGQENKAIIELLQKIAAFEPPASNPERDKIIADQYFFALSEFLVKFRINLHCLPLSNPIEPSIEDAFHPGHNMLQTAPDLQKINADLIEFIFTRYDFTQPLTNFTPEKGSVSPTNLSFLLGELRSLNKKCVDILNKYAGTGSPRLVLKIEVIKNRIDNLIGPFGLARMPIRSKSNLDALGEFFELLKDSFETLQEYR